MKNKLHTVEARVLRMMQENEYLRDDDMQLYLMVCKDCCQEYENILSLPFGFVMSNYKELKIPHFESVRRTRAKVQSEHPELASSPEISKRRRRKKQEYKEYALS